MFRCQYYKEGGCDKALCPHYEAKDVCEVESIDEDEQGYYRVHEEVSS